MRTVLITGGSGFLGRRLAVVLSDHMRVVLGARNSEVNLLAGEQTGCDVVPLDVSSIESVRDTFAQVAPEIVIHAAATKFVGLGEYFPMQCVDVNVLGSQNVARVGMERGAEVVLGISTDKAAPPAGNTYGLSKALMERMFCSMDNGGTTRFACVRFGNIAWSSASVFPEWKRMHDKTGVIGSTGPDHRRFFFSVDEAVELVRTALDRIDEIRGCVLSRRMKAARIRDLLDVWTSEKGGSWHQIASRPGDRDDETLIGETELAFTESVVYDGVEHYRISFSQKAATPLSQSLSSATAERLSREEMLHIIEHPAEILQLVEPLPK